jgi:bacterial/archaeal transporter family-2 protein
MTMTALQNVLFALLALAAGTSFVVQQAVNSNLRTEIGSAWWAGFVSYLGGTLVMLALIVVLRPPLASAAQLSRSTWWSWTGGLFGAVYIAVAILLVPRLGAFAVVALIVVGQLLTSLAFDALGVLNVPVHAFSLSRAVGAVLLVTGAVLVLK